MNSSSASAQLRLPRNADRRAFPGAGLHHHPPLALLLVALAYYVGTRVGCLLVSPSIPTSIVWLPNATMFAVFLLAPPREWWAYVLAVLPAHVAFAAGSHIPVATAALLFVTNLGDGALGALAVRWLMGGGRTFEGVRRVTTFMFVAVTAPVLVSLLDAGVIVATGWGSGYWTIWATRSRSNALVNLIWVPAVVLTATSNIRRLKEVRPERLIEAGLLALTLVLAGAFAAAVRPTTAGRLALVLCAPLPVLLWTTFRFGIRETALAVLVLAGLVIWNAIRGRGPFAGPSPSTNVTALQTYLGALSALFVLMTAAWNEQAGADARVRNHEAQYEGIFESISEGVLVTDHRHRIVTANRALCRLTGYEIGGLRTLQPRNLLQVGDLRPIHAHLDGLGTAEEIAISGVGHRADGTEFPFDAQIRRVDYRGRPHLLSIVREVTPKREAAPELAESAALAPPALLTPIEVFDGLRSTIELRPLLRALLRQANVLVPHAHATVCFHAKEGDVSLVEHWGPLSARALDQVRVSPALIGKWPVLFPETPLIVGDLQATTGGAGAVHAAVADTFAPILGFARSLMMIPLKAGTRPVGMLWLAREGPNRFTPRDAQLGWVLANQAAIGLENARLYEQAHESASFEERQRMARDLHDSVTQSLSAMAMMAEVLPGTLDHNPEVGRRALANLQQMIRGALAEVRSMLVDVHPAALLAVPLVDLLTQLANTVRARRAIALDLGLDPELLLPPSVHVVFFRVAHEALNNVAKHAGAANAKLVLRRTGDGAALSISDDGIGFTDVEPTFRHLGIRIMHERAASVGATVRIDSAPNRGTTVSLEWKGSTEA